MDVAQTIRPLAIETVKPVAKGLAIHPAYPDGVSSVHAGQDARQRQKASALVGILGFLGKPTKVGG